MAKKIDNLSELMAEFQKIEADTLSINRLSENNNAPANNAGNDNANIDADIDSLLQQNGGNAPAGGGDAANDPNALPDLSTDDNNANAPVGNDANAGQGDDNPLAGLDQNAGADAAAPADAGGGDNNNFATDSEGLVDAITKLTKAGKTVKIVVSAETNQPMISIDGKKATMQQLTELMKNGGDKMTPEMKAMSERIDKLTSLIMNMNSAKTPVKPIAEDKIIKIKESNYNMLTEMVQDLKYKVDEQEALIKNYESLKGFAGLDENDQDISKIIQEMSSSVDELNKYTSNMKVARAASRSYAAGSDLSLGVMNTMVLPVLTEALESKFNVLSMFDDIDNSIKLEVKPVDEVVDNSDSILETLDAINEDINYLDKVNFISKYNELIKKNINKVLSENKRVTRGDLQMILTEAASDIIITSGDNSIDVAPNNFPTYETFDKVVQRNLQNAFYKSDKSDITVKDEEDTLNPKSQMKKFDLPITKPEKWNANITIKSAMTNLQEALTDVDGNIDLALCEQAYLYKRAKTPHSIKDFAFPIAIMNFQEHKLYAHPTLIENVAKILKNDSCMRTYDIKSREDLYALREALTPYLEKIGIDAPWATPKIPEKLAKESKDETKK